MAGFNRTLKPTNLWMVLLFIGPFCEIATESTAPTTNTTRANVDRRDELRVFFDLLESRGYQKEIPPYPETGAIKVVMSMWVTALSDINEQTQDFSLSIYFRQEWMDDRLAYADTLPNSRYLDISSMANKIVWLPDPYFEYGKEEHVHDVTTSNTLLSISPTGLVFYSQRITLTHWCHVSLKHFPLDFQKCEIRIISYGNRNDEVQFGWVTGDPLLNIKAIPLTKFRVHSLSKGGCTTTYDVAENKTTDPFSCINATITFKRDIGHYLLQVYIPSTLIIMLSWVSFWLDADAVPGRISLGLLTVLSMSTQMSYTVNGDMPKVSYVRAIDVWMTTCLIFLFGGLVEFALVNSLVRRGNIRKEKRTNTENRYTTATELNSNQNDKNQQADVNSNGSVHSQDDRRYSDCVTARRIDVASRVIFPLVFAIFCAVYWVAYQEKP